MRSLIVSIVWFACTLKLSAADHKITLEPHDNGIKVLDNGKLFTDYVIKSKTKPILWPVNAPNGLPLTRAWPMSDDTAGEKKDHPHHRSLWFTHGDVNGIDFWMEEPTKNGKFPGITEHQKFAKSSADDSTATIVSENIWKSPEGKPVLDDVREIKFGADDQARWIDFKITLIANYGPVKFGDTKEGTFGIRVAETAKVEAKLGGKIVTSEGKVDDKAWGTRAAWVDYHGPVGPDKTRMGIAILNHPSSFRHPTHWHVRTYGLFAANPFGIHDFEKQKDPVGEHTLKDKEKMVLRYRVILHHGDETEGRIAERYADFAK